MLLRFSAENFSSFVERAEVRFDLTTRDKPSGWVRTSSQGTRYTTLMAVMGANGAGKTSLVKVGPFLSWFVRHSFNIKPDDDIPFLAHQTRSEEPSTFEVEVEDDKHAWLYRLSLTRSTVLHESLRRKAIGGDSRYGYLFERDWVEPEKRYLVKQQGFGLAESEAAKVRQNVSFISWAAQYGIELASTVSDFIVVTNVTLLGLERERDTALTDAGSFLNEQAHHFETTKALLSRWDLGLTSMELVKVAASAEDRNKKDRWFPFGVHTARDGSAFSLPFSLESSGTKAAMLLLVKLLPVLESGGVAFMDELDNHIHPHMLESILRLFHDEATNPLGAQILFTCQTPEVLKLLHRTQVMFVEKTTCESTAYRGDEIEGLTNEHNLYAKYTSGALGAVPQL